MSSNTNNTNDFKQVNNPIWLSVSEAASLGGVGDKTIRRAIKDPSSEIVFRIIKDRYQIDLGSLIVFMHRNTKLNNKLKDLGLGQYVEKWKEGEKKK